MFENSGVWLERYGIYAKNDALTTSAGTNHRFGAYSAYTTDKISARKKYRSCIRGKKYGTAITHNTLQNNSGAGLSGNFETTYPTPAAHATEIKIPA
jgi:hypothetical protein